MRRHGFTLIEVMVSLALVVMLALLLVGFVRDLRSQQRLIEGLNQEDEAGAILVDSLERDLSVCVADAGRFGAGVRGDATSLRVLWRGVGLADEGREWDLQGSSYAFERTSGALRAWRWTPGAGAGDASGPGEMLTDRVERLRFRYYDGREWGSSFDSLQRGGLPRAVEVAVWFKGLVKRAPERDASAGVGLGAEEQDVKDEKPLGQPHRLRVFAIPDAGVLAGAPGTGGAT